MKSHHMTAIGFKQAFMSRLTPLVFGVGDTLNAASASAIFNSQRGG
jgi:hypothetical protein